ncbi:MAG: methylmalonyl Co-A mutase-associated GTPase MeaB [Syntrophomonadaceae bacterium]|nr:methylmalonyl Co-A mutase-associated GTPase MeaB [Syntrophomonadaceae bacterium]
MKELGKRVLEGDVRAASRLIRNLEDQITDTYIAIQEIFKETGKSHVIGITGAPGAGKSTLTDELIQAYRSKGNTVGVLAVDPTSPFTGGALLGDRIRMLRHAEDPGVWVRSLATRGAMGGLSKAVGEGIHVMDVIGKDRIIVETVGVGQQEVEIINHAHTVIVVLVPGMGDEIQALKAGLMEVADIFVINKADRDGAGKLYKETMNMIQMSRDRAGVSKGWQVPVLLVESVMEPHKFAESVEKLRDKIEDHYQFLVDNDLISERMRRKTAAEIQEALWGAIMCPILQQLESSGEMKRMVDRCLLKEADPYSVADDIAERYIKEELDSYGDS